MCFCERFARCRSIMEVKRVDMSLFKVAWISKLFVNNCLSYVKYVSSDRVLNELRSPGTEEASRGYYDN